MMIKFFRTLYCFHFVFKWVFRSEMLCSKHTNIKTTDCETCFQGNKCKCKFTCSSTYCAIRNRKKGQKVKNKNIKIFNTSNEWITTAIHSWFGTNTFLWRKLLIKFFYIFCCIYRKICDMIANEITLHKRSHDTEINNYMSPYCLWQWAKPIPHSPL